MHLRALVSCPTLISDDDIKVYRYDEHVFDVIIDSQQKLADLDGSRMIVTLEARTPEGNVAYRDITFALRSEKEPVAYVEPALVEREVEGESVEIPHYWFRKYGFASEETQLGALQAAADDDADMDGMSNWQEFVRGTSPVDASDRLQIKGLLFNVDNTLKEIIYEPKAIKDGTIRLEGKNALSDSAWKDADLSSHRFFRLRVTVGQ